MKQDDFKVSVAMCTFNGAAFVEAQLESIFAQSRLPDEILVCDDGSTDGTVDLLTRIAQKCPDKLRISDILGARKNMIRNAAGRQKKVSASRPPHSRGEKLRAGETEGRDGRESVGRLFSR